MNGNSELLLPLPMPFFDKEWIGALQSNRTTSIIDCCSGGGAVVLILLYSTRVQDLPSEKDEEE